MTTPMVPLVASIRAEIKLVEQASRKHVETMRDLSQNSLAWDEYWAALSKFGYQWRNVQTLIDYIMECTDKREVLATPIAQLPLGIRAYHCLTYSHISTIGDLIQYDRPSLLRIKNLGKGTLAEIEGVLDTVGVALNGQLPNCERVTP